jgi:hypothetical protein
VSDPVSFAQLESAVYGMEKDYTELKSEVRTLTDMVRRIIVLEERAEGIKRAHGRIDTLVRMFWSGCGAIALAIFIAWFNRHM